MSVKDLFSRITGKDKKEVQTADEGDKPKVVNGYLQTSNTKVIRPVYSNTRAGRIAQEKKAKELSSDDDEQS